MSTYQLDIQSAVNDFLADQIDRATYEHRCMLAWKRQHGPVPHGRKLVVGVLDDRVVIGHVEQLAA